MADEQLPPDPGTSPVPEGHRQDGEHTAALLGHFEAADYSMQHTAPNPAAGHLPLHHYQGGSPDEPVRIYRSAPPGTESINAGDWISLSPEYAHQHGRHATDPGKDWPVYTAEVPQKHVHWDENDPQEHGYNGPVIRHPDVHDEETGEHHDWHRYDEAHPHGLEAWAGASAHLSPAEHEFVHDDCEAEDDRATTLLDAARAQGSLRGARWRDDLYPARDDAEAHAQAHLREAPEGHRTTAFTVHRDDQGTLQRIGIHHFEPSDDPHEHRRYQHIDDLPSWHYGHPEISRIGTRRGAAVHEAELSDDEIHQGLGLPTAEEGHKGVQKEHLEHFKDKFDKLFLGDDADWEDYRLNKSNENMMDLRRRYEGGSGHFGFSHNEDDEPGSPTGSPYYEIRHRDAKNTSTGWRIRHYNDGPLAEIEHEGTPGESHQTVELPAESYASDTPHEWFGHEHLHKILHDWHAGVLDPDEPDESRKYLEGPHGEPGIRRWQRRHLGSVPGDWVTSSPAYARENGQREAAVQHHGISGETAPEGDGIFARPSGPSPVYRHYRHMMEHPGESARVTEDGSREWVHPHLSAPDHGPYHVIHDAADPDVNEGTLHVVDRNGGFVSHPHGYKGGWGHEQAYQDWHRLTYRQEPEDPGGPDMVDMLRDHQRHAAEHPPQFPHSRVNPLDEEILKRPDARVAKPQGHSPSEEYHGSYEVVRHPGTGRFHVVDNAGRSAHTLPLDGFETQLQAERSRDYTEKRQQSKEKARGIAESLWGGAHEALDPGGTDESRHSERNMETASDLMSRYEGGLGEVKFDDDRGGEPYYEREHLHGSGAPSGWYARHYGGPRAEMYHRATGDESHDLLRLPEHPEDVNSMIPRLHPSFGDDDLAAKMKTWHDDSEGGMREHQEESDPRIQRWKQRRTGSAHDVVAHFEMSAPEPVRVEGKIIAWDDKYPTLEDPHGSEPVRYWGNGLKQLRHPNDVPGPLYHGSNREFEPGEQIEPGHPGNFVSRMKHVYMTEQAEPSDSYKGARGYGRHVYEVRPTGPFGQRRDARRPEWATEDPLEVIRRVPDPREERGRMAALAARTGELGGLAEVAHPRSDEDLHAHLEGAHRLHAEEISKEDPWDLHHDEHTGGWDVPDHKHEQYYHGTSLGFPDEEDPPEHIVPQGERRFYPGVHSGEHAHAVSRPETAWSYAERAWNWRPGSSQPRVLRVRPTGPFEDDPGAVMRGGGRETEEGAVRSLHPWAVTGEEDIPEEYLHEREDEPDEDQHHEAALMPGPDQRSAAEERGDRWHEYRNSSNDHLHRGIIVRLPEYLHNYVHDDSVPREGRAAALQQHFADSGEGLGMHWTPHPQIAQRAIWNAASGDESGHGAYAGSHGGWDEDRELEDSFGDDDEDDSAPGSPHTEVMFHVRRPGERNRLPQRDQEQHGIGWLHSHDEDEFPLRPGTPLRLAGISWKQHEPEYPNQPMEHHDFAKPMRHVSSAVTPQPLPAVVAHFEDGNDEDFEEESYEPEESYRRVAPETDEHGFEWPMREGMESGVRERITDEPPRCQGCARSAHSAYEYHWPEDGHHPDVQARMDRDREREDRWDRGEYDRTRFCGVGCEQGHAEDQRHGVSTAHTFSVGEPEWADHPHPLDADMWRREPHSVSPHEESPDRRDSRYEVRDPSAEHRCHYCRSVLPQYRRTAAHDGPEGHQAIAHFEFPRREVQPGGTGHEEILDHLSRLHGYTGQDIDAAAARGRFANQADNLRDSHRGDHLRRDGWAQNNHHHEHEPYGRHPRGIPSDAMVNESAGLLYAGVNDAVARDAADRVRRNHIPGWYEGLHGADYPFREAERPDPQENPGSGTSSWADAADYTAHHGPIDPVFGSRQAAYDWATDEGPYTWDEIARRHPHVYGDDEDHAPGMGEGGGHGIADAAAELYHDRPSHPYSESTGELHPENDDSMEFHPRTVDVNRIDYMRVDPGERDPRVERAKKGFQDWRQREKIPPLILVHRHGVYQVADGSHRANGAAQAGWPSVRAYVAYSPHEHEPFAGRDGEPPARAPFHGAETEDRPPMMDHNGEPARRISYPGFPHTADVPHPHSREAALVAHFGGRGPAVPDPAVRDTVLAPAGIFAPLLEAIAAFGAWEPQSTAEAARTVGELEEVFEVLREGLRHVTRMLEDLPLHPDVADAVHEVLRAASAAEADFPRIARMLPPEAAWEEPGRPNR